MRFPCEIAVIAGAAAVVCCVSAPPPVYPSSEVCLPGGSPLPNDARPPALIEDAEDGDQQIIDHDGRNGLVFTFVDPETPLVLAPTLSPRRPLPILGGANGSRCAWNLRGSLAHRRIAFAGLGVNMMTPKAFYDASRYAGISFYARRSPGTAARMRVSITDWNTDPDGGVCTECFNHFGQEIVLSEAWTLYTLPFESLRQQPRWGAPRPRQIDSSRIFFIVFGMFDRSAPFDVWIDDLAFIERAPPPAPRAP